MPELRTDGDRDPDGLCAAHVVLSLPRRAEMAKMRVELMAETRAIVNATEQTLRDHIEVVLDPYRSLPQRVGTLEEQALPERVSKLEARVFAPRRRRAPAAGRKRR